MKTENMLNYSYNTLHDFYMQGMITQAQWEAYDFAWAKLHPCDMPYYWSSLEQDARIEFWKLYRLFPENIRKILHPLA